MSKYKPSAKDYVNYNKSLGYYQFKDLHLLLAELYNCIPIDKRFFNNDDVFEFDGMNCYVDFDYDAKGNIKFNNCQCEIKGTEYLPLKKRITLHKKKLKQYKKEVIQMKIPFG